MEKQVVDLTGSETEGSQDHHVACAADSEDEIEVVEVACTKRRRLVEDLDALLATQLSQETSGNLKSSPFEAEKHGGILIRDHLLECLRAEHNSEFWLCWERCELRHIGQQDSWSCGFRNLQMIFRALMHMDFARERMFDMSGRVPSISTLQHAIEKAWKEGFDPAGAETFNGRVVGTRRWIGAVEAMCLLRSQGIVSVLVDFEGQSSFQRLVRFVELSFRLGSRKALALASSAPSRLDGEEVAVEGFDSGEKSAGKALPMYLQYQGHSLTVVGFQRRSVAGEVHEFLLVLDSAVNSEQLEASLKCKSGWQRLMKRSVRALGKKCEFQLVVIAPGEYYSSAADWEASKHITSIKVK